jgi:NAD(P)-dependent dehydrogenase (short-subunit alcohol dehydrogenase family)
MVDIETIRSINSTLATFTVTNTSTTPFTAVVIGGTAGIGERTVLAIATNFSTSGEKLRLFVVGRNESAATRIVDEAQKISPKAAISFIRAGNLALLKEVAKTADDVVAAIGGKDERLDLLVMTSGYLTLKSWNGELNYSILAG